MVDIAGALVSPGMSAPKLLELRPRAMIRWNNTLSANLVLKSSYEYLP